VVGRLVTDNTGAEEEGDVDGLAEGLAEIFGFTVGR